MTSPGPAPPCVQASKLGPSSAPGTHEAGGSDERKGLIPRTPSTPLWYGITTAASAGQGSAPEGAAGATRTPRRPPFTFIAPLGLVRPMTRTHVRLLGPCFKTGRVGHRPFARRERNDWRGCAPLLHDRRRAARTPEVSPFAGAEARDVGVPVQPGLRRPQQRVAATYITRGNTPADADLSAGTPKSSWVASANPDTQPALADELNPLGSTFEVPPVWLLTVSRTLELSLQSSFQLSLTVLVRYRSRGHI